MTNVMEILARQLGEAPGYTPVMRVVICSEEGVQAVPNQIFPIW